MPPSAEPEHPVALTRAAVLVALEGFALTAAGVAVAVSGLVGEPDDRAGSVLLGLLVLGLGLVLLPVARALHALRGWAWAPTILLQVFVGIAAVGALQVGSWPVALPMGLLGATVLYQLATPEARLAYGRD